jgi:hypothetical protein
MAKKSPRNRDGVERERMETGSPGIQTNICGDDRADEEVSLLEIGN